MLRVLIVDDEYLLCEHIRHSIDWVSLGMEVVGSARDGVQGLACVRALKPDIVLADINMPNMDGLEFAKQLQLEAPEIRVILVTGYGEFKYAQTAMRYGVERYLLKPIDGELYTAELAIVRDEIFKRKQELTEMDALRTDMQAMNERPYPDFSAFFGDLNSEEQILNALNENGIYISEEMLCAVIVKWQWKEEGLQNEAKVRAEMENGRDFSMYALGDIPHAVFENGERSFVAVISQPEAVSDALIAALEHYCAEVEQRLGACVYMGVSDFKSGFMNIRGLYIQAQRAHASTYVMSDYKVITYRQIGEEAIYSLSQYFETERLRMDLRLNNVDGIFSAIDEAFLRLRQHAMSKENVVFTTLMMITTLLEFLEEVNVSIAGFRISEISRQANARNTIHDLHTLTTMLFEKALENVFFQANPGKSERAQKACRYIRENYADKQLSLKTVANALYLNPSYLSSLFRKETSVTLVEYINQTRLKKAKTMMDEYPEMTIAQIAEDSGYNNEYYFMRLFKKQYGITPKSYINLKNQEEDL